MATKYRIGDWIAVPLPDGTWAMGRIARGKRGILLGYFFGPRRRTVPRLDELQHLRADAAEYVTAFGDMGLRKEEWPVLGGHEDFDPTAWPMPGFRGGFSKGQYWRIEYADDNPSQ